MKTGGSILHVTNALKGRKSTTFLGYSWRWNGHLCYIS